MIECGLNVGKGTKISPKHDVVLHNTLYLLPENDYTAFEKPGEDVRKKEWGIYRVIYARVSPAKRWEDLERQVAALRAEFS